MHRYNREQGSKGKGNYAMACEDNFNRIVQLAKAGRFPGENLIGPDDHLGWEYVLPLTKGGNEMKGMGPLA